MTDKMPEMGDSPEKVLAYMGTDAERWTQMFLKLNGLENAGPEFVGNVLGWFANAIETGRQTEYGRTIPHLALLANETAHQKGWWEEPKRAFDGVLMLIVSEVSEALEEWRNGRDEDERYYTIPPYRPEPDNLPQEVRDIAYAFERRGSGAVVNADELSEEEAEILVHMGFLKPEGVPAEFADIFIRLGDAAIEYGFDLEQEIILKMAYNATRQHRHGGKRS